MTINPLTTLARIRAHHPCAWGWSKVLTALGPDLDAPISLGDIATSNGPADVFWCIRAIDWSDIAVRRAVIGSALLPALRRSHVAAHKEKSEPSYLVDFGRWCAGDDTVDIKRVASKARNAAGYAAAAADYAAAKTAADYAGYAAAYAVDYLDYATERAQQRADIIAAFPRVRLHPLGVPT